MGATSRGLPLRVLGGGSNLVVADEGVDGARGAARHSAASQWRESGGAVEVDRRRRRALGRPRAPHRRPRLGRARVPERHPRPRRRHADPERRRLRPGGEPDTIGRVRVLDRASGTRAPCARGAAASPTATARFKSGEPERYVVLAVTYRLRPGGAPDRALRRARSATSPRAAGATPTLGDVRDERAGDAPREVDGAGPGRRESAQLRLVLHEPDRRRAEAAAQVAARAAAAPRDHAELARAERAREALRGVADRARRLRARASARGRGPLDTPHARHRLPRRRPRRRRRRLRAPRARARRGALRRPPRARACVLGRLTLD